MRLRVALLACFSVSVVSCDEPSMDGEPGASQINAVNESQLGALSRVSSPTEALRLLPVSIGDQVRIVPSQITDELKISGMVGVVIETSNSGSGATVFVNELDRKFGLTSNLLELVELPTGTIISMGDKKWVSNQDNEWEEISSDR